MEAGATITKSSNSTNDISVSDKFLVHSYYGSRPDLSVYDKMTAVTAADDGQTIEYDGTDTLKIYVADASGFTQLENIRVLVILVMTISIVVQIISSTDENSPLLV